MISNPLVPTPIVDKNGRQTTVHRRSGGPVSSSVSAIPAPSSPPTKTDRLTPYERRSLVDAIEKEARRASVSGRNVELVKHTMYGYPEELLTRISEVQSESGDTARMVNYLLMEGVTGNEVSEMIHFAPFMSSGIRLFVAQNFLRSLHHYPQLPPSDDYGKESEEVRSKAEAIIRVADAMFSYTGVLMFKGVGSMIDEETLIDLAVSNPEKSQLLASAIKSRKTTEIGVLREVLEADNAPLSEGVL